MGGGPRPPAGRPVPRYRPMPRYRPTPEYPLLPGCPLPGYRPMPAEPQAECWRAGYLTAPDCPPVPDYPALPPYLSARDRPPPGRPVPPQRDVRALPRRPARRAPRDQAAAWSPGRAAAVLGYLTVPLAVVPAMIYLGTLRGPRPARRHAAQAVNVWFTGVLYDLAAVIMGAMLALDSPRTALIVFAPLVAARWVVTLTYLARAARAAGRGAPYAFPSWLCMRLAR